MLRPYHDLSVTVVIPTIGRLSLAFTLASVLPQLGRYDRVHVVADTSGDMDAVRDITPISQKIKLFNQRPNEEGYGYAQREFGTFTAATTHVAFLDDDDVYVPNALKMIREHADRELPTIFKMRYGSKTFAHEEGDELWTQEKIEYGNVGTPMIVVPNNWTKMGSWRAHWAPDGIPRGGDFTFISETVENFGGVKWDEHVLALIRPADRQCAEKSLTSSIS